MSYVDGFVILVVIVNKEDYVKVVNNMVEFFIKYGVSMVCECWGVDVLLGEIIFFFVVVKFKDGEMVVFFWVEWFFKEVCDKVMLVFFDEMQFVMIFDNMFFDGQCFIFGSFEIIVFCQS